MGSRLPRRPRIFAAHRPARDAGRAPVPVEDPWAGEDDDWTSDVAAEDPGDFVRFFRGAVFGVVAGVLLWGLIVLGLVFLLG